MILEAVSAILAIVGVIFIAYKNKMGFLIWVFGNILWIVYGIQTSQYFFTAQYVVFTFTSIWGFYKWKNDAKKPNKIKKRKKK